MAVLARLLAFVPAAFIASQLTCTARAADDRRVRTVLTVHGGTEDFPANLVLDPAIQEALAPSAELPIDYFAEYLESDRFGSGSAAPALRDYIRQKYQQRRIDVVLAVTSEALRFVLEYRDELFPGVPVVFMGLAVPEAVVRDPERSLAAILVSIAYAETLKVALELHPSTEQVFVVARSSRQDMDAVREALGGFSRRVRLTYLSEPTVPRLLAALRGVPPRSLVLYIWDRQDEPGHVLLPDRIARLVAQAAPVPVYGTSDFYIGSGIVGGVMRVTRETGTRLGTLARQILEGARPQDIPFEKARVVPTFDWRQLRRWRIDPSQLPAGSVIRFQTPTVWESYRWVIIPTAVVIVAQLLLIAGLVTQHGRWRSAENTIRINEASLRRSFERIRQLAGHLMTAQETVRADIARDLHDDVCQDLVGVSMAIDSLRRGSGHVQDNETQRALSDLHGWALALVDGVRRLSHELHPATLQLAGLAVATKAHCVEVEKRYDVQVSVNAVGDLCNVNRDVALCLFRIAQEALRNAAVHGEARRIDVSITRSAGQIELAVTDDGRGFDLPTTRKTASGLGLLSIEERAHLVGGSVRIGSEPGLGTRICVLVPAGAPSDVNSDKAHMRVRRVASRFSRPRPEEPV